MAVPLLAPGYLETVKQLKAQSAESAKNRKAQQDLTSQGLAADFGKLALGTIADFGNTAFKNSLEEPLALAREGAYIPEGLDTRKAAIDAVKGKLLGDGAGMFGGTKAEEPSAPAETGVNAPQKLTPPADDEPAYKPPKSLPKPPSSSGPATPDEKNPTFASGLPEETPVVVPRKPVAATPAPVSAGPTAPKAEATETVSDAFKGLGARIPERSNVAAALRGVAGGRSGAPPAWSTAPTPTGPDLSMLSPRERGLYEASQSILAGRKSETDYRSAQMQPKLADAEMRDAKLALLNAQAKAAQARAEKDHPSDPAAQSRAMEEARAKAWIEAGKLSKNIEKRVSSSGARGPGVSNGSVVVNVGGGSSNSPIFKAVVYADEAGFPVIVGADATGKFIKRNEDGSFYQFFADRPTLVFRKDAQGKYAGSVVPPLAPSVTVPARPASSGPVQRKATAPAAAPQATEGTAAPQKPITEITDPVELTRRENELRAAMDRAAVEGASPRDRAATEDAATLAAIARQRKLIEDQKASAAKMGSGGNLAAAQSAYQSAVSDLQGIGAKESDAVENRIRSTDKLFPMVDGRYKEGGASLNERSLSEAKRGVPYAPVGDPEIDEPRSKLYEKVRTTYNTARQQGGQDFSRQKVAAAKSALLGYFRSHPDAEGVSLGQMLGEWGVDLSDGEKREVLRALQPDQPALAPGPSQPPPPQHPPPKSKADDLFDRINAQPWSAAKKRRVFLATAQRDGLQ